MIEKIPQPTESVVETKTVYSVTATFTFTEEDLQDTETRAFYDLLVRTTEEETDQANGY
jgi:hypothetical protein